jgi:hypothetical protein
MLGGEKQKPTYICEHRLDSAVAGAQFLLKIAF